MTLTKDRKGNLIEYLFYSLQVREKFIVDPAFLATGINSTYKFYCPSFIKYESH